MIVITAELHCARRGRVVLGYARIQNVGGDSDIGDYAVVFENAEHLQIAQTEVHSFRRRELSLWSLLARALRQVSRGNRLWRVAPGQVSEVRR